MLFRTSGVGAYNFITKAKFPNTRNSFGEELLEKQDAKFHVCTMNSLLFKRKQSCEKLKADKNSFEDFVLLVFTVTPSKIKFETIEYQKLRISNVTKD